MNIIAAKHTTPPARPCITSGSLNPGNIAKTIGYPGVRRISGCWQTCFKSRANPHPCLNPAASCKYSNESSGRRANDRLLRSSGMIRRTAASVPKPAAPIMNENFESPVHLVVLFLVLELTPMHYCNPKRIASLAIGKLLSSSQVISEPTSLITIL